MLYFVKNYDTKREGKNVEEDEEELVDLCTGRDEVKLYKY